MRRLVKNGHINSEDCRVTRLAPYSPKTKQADGVDLAGSPMWSPAAESFLAASLTCAALAGVVDIKKDSLTMHSQIPRRDFLRIGAAGAAAASAIVGNNVRA